MLFFLYITLGPGLGGPVHVSQLPGPVLPVTFFVAWKGGVGSWGAGSLGTQQAVSGALPSLGTLTLPTSMQDKVVCFSSLWVVKKLFLVCTCQTQA